MKKIIFIITTLLIGINALSQSLFSSRLPFHGGTLAVSSTENMGVADRSGYLWYVESIDSLWTLAPMRDKANYPYGGMSIFEHVTLFNRDTLMISGFIRENNLEGDFVLWSGDKGKNWEKIKFGYSSWLNAFYHLPNGKAWMSGSSQYIYYTEDFGKTWKQFDKVEKEGNLRFQSLCFAKDGKVGLFGSLWNVIYKTSDNCQTWEKLPTPYTQKKYKWQYGSGDTTGNRPEITKIRMIGNYYISKQDGRTCITKANDVDWMPLSSVLDFEVTANEKIYLIYKDYTVELLDCNLATLWKSIIHLPSDPTSIAVQNETLFFITSYFVVAISPERFYIKETFTDEFSISEPYLQVDYEKEKYGFDEKDVLLYDKLREQWKRFLTTDFLIGNISNYKGELLISNVDLTKHFILDIEQKKLKPFMLPERIIGEDISIRGFNIEIGSKGCFHYDVARRVYEREKDVLVSNPRKDTTGDLNEMPTQLDISIIENLIMAIDSLKCHPLSLTDLEITEEDILDFQSFVDKESLVTEDRTPYLIEEEIPLYTFDNNTDYNYYRRITSLLDKVNDDTMGLIFSLSSRKLSTTTDWHKITILLDNHTTIEIRNEDNKPNYYYSPWIISSNGLKFKVNSFEVGRMINTLTNNCFLRKKFREKRYLLFQIADYFYRKEVLN